MTPRYTIASKSVCELVQQRASKLHGYPREGVDGGPRCGKHDCDRGLGWTLHQYAVDVERDDLGEDAKTGKCQTQLADPDVEGDKRALTAAVTAELRGKWADGKAKPVAAAKVMGPDAP